MYLDRILQPLWQQFLAKPREKQHKGIGHRPGDTSFIRLYKCNVEVPSAWK